jgi:DNA repair exonuclease SbcCD ATPase subunit
MKKMQLDEVEQEELIEMVNDLQRRLKKKTSDLSDTRVRLQRAKTTIQRLKETINYQRERILTLYKEEEVPPPGQ